MKLVAILATVDENKATIAAIDGAIAWLVSVMKAAPADGRSALRACGALAILASLEANGGILLARAL